MNLLKELNVSVNVLSFVLIMAGAGVGIYSPEIGKLIIVGGLGVFGGGNLAKSQLPNQ